jgi:hypothetical protein
VGVIFALRTKMTPTIELKEIKKQSARFREHSVQSTVLALFVRLGSGFDFGDRYHAFENHFKSHGMAAAASSLEELAVAVPFAIFIADRMWIIFAVERHLEIVEMNSVAFLGIALGFLDFANHAIVHGLKISFRANG